MEDQNTGPTQAQNTGNIDQRTVQDLIGSQIEDDGTSRESNGDNISDDQDPAILDDQTFKASQDDNYHTAIDEDDLDDTVQFGNPVTQPFLSRSVRVPTTKDGARCVLAEHQLKSCFKHQNMSERPSK